MLLSLIGLIACIAACWRTCRSDGEQAALLPFADDPDAARRMSAPPAGTASGSSSPCRSHHHRTECAPDLQRSCIPAFWFPSPMDGASPSADVGTLQGSSPREPVFSNFAPRTYRCPPSPAGGTAPPRTCPTFPTHPPARMAARLARRQPGLPAQCRHLRPAVRLRGGPALRRTLGCFGSAAVRRFLRRPGPALVGDRQLPVRITGSVADRFMATRRHRQRGPRPWA